MMKLLSTLVLVAFMAWAVDVTGRWRGEAVVEGAAQPVFITLFQNGNALTGSGGPTIVDQDILSNGKIQGNRIAFDIVPGGRAPLHFELANDGEWLKGTMRVQHNGRTVTGAVTLRKRTN
jgi:hypothetical protein